MLGIAHLHHAQVLESILDQLLYLAVLRLLLVLTKSISRPAAGVLAEVEARELGGLPEHGAELSLETVRYDRFIQDERFWGSSMRGCQRRVPTRERTWKAVSREIATDIVIE